MPIPWLAALKIIPWGTIIENTPVLARSAERLLRGTKSEPAPPAASASDILFLAERLQVLEQRDRETAELLGQVTAQMSALATATEVLEARVRWLLVLSIALTAIVAVLAGVVVFFR